MRNSVTVCHPTGNANVRNVLRGLADAAQLNTYQTTVAAFSSGHWYQISSLPGLGEVRRRSYEDDLRPMVRTAPARELARLAALRFGLDWLVRKETGPLSIERVYEAIDRKTAARVHSNSVSACYCYEDGALHTFQAAKAAGKKCIYDLPIGYWRAAREILSVEAERRPEWRATLGGLNDSAAKLSRKDEELRLADRILVASTFTKQTLAKCPFPIAPVTVIPYGADDASVTTAQPRLSYRGQRLKVLFVGGLSQRKGIADLFEAVETLSPHVELTVVGRKPAQACAALESALKKHRWIESLPREKVLVQMRAHDVLVFPSLFEGFGLVVTEALSQGLPVITTSHTCGPDVLTEGEDGFIVPIRDPEAIAEKLQRLHRDRERLAAMSVAARKKAETLTWESYRQGVVEVVREALVPA
jgi:glycosyltransferase involved in cell wall biosynthesis